MEIKQTHELDFWRSIYSEAYPEFRVADGKIKMKFFPDLPDRDGIGLDLGNGLVSVFSGLKNQIVAIDPLNDKYNEIYDYKKDGNVAYLTASGEEIPFPKDYFDYVFCCNVIDHTPNPDKMISEIKRVLKKGCKLYFQVNFDDYLSPCHYDLWDEDMVKKYLKGFKLLDSMIERNDKGNQSIYHAIYENL